MILYSFLINIRKNIILKAFKSIAEALSGYTEKCVISFVDIYPKIKKYGWIVKL